MEVEDKRKTGSYDPKGIGEQSESQILARFLKHGLTVLMPFGDNQRYDLVVDEDGDFIRVQCKTANLERDGRSFTFPTASSNWYRGTTRTYIGEVDVFAVYSREEDEVYIVKVDNAPRKSCRIRLRPPKANTGRRARQGRDHLFKPNRSLRSYS